MICEGSVILRLHEVVCLKERGSVVMWRIADKEGPTGVMECPYCAEGKAYWVKEATYTMTHHDERVSGYMADCPYDIRAIEVQPQHKMERSSSRFTVTPTIALLHINDATERDAFMSGIRQAPEDGKHLPAFQHRMDVMYPGCFSRNDRFWTVLFTRIPTT